MTDSAAMRELLGEEQRETQRLIDSLTSNIDDLSSAREGDNSDDEHDPEGSTLAFERSQADAVLIQSRDRLTQIAEALERLDDGTFGTCTSCGQAIPAVRLEVRPYTPICVACAS